MSACVNPPPTLPLPSPEKKGGVGRSGSSEDWDERVVFILPVLHIFLGGMSIVCKNEPTPAGGKKGIQKRNEPRSGRRRTRRTEEKDRDEDDGGRGGGGRERIKIKTQIEPWKRVKVHTLYFVTLMHYKWRRWWTEVDDLPMHKLDQGLYHLLG